jgi:ribosomal protein S18 acetylase RimI-like enzyme
MTPFEIAPARTPEGLNQVRTLFQAYADGLGIDLTYQGFPEELATLPGKYAQPHGELLLAKLDGKSVGCVGLRPLEDGACEMKRLYVDPQARGLKLGKALVEAIIQAAIERGYKEMRLDTMSTMTEAISLYKGLGFAEIPAYFDSPLVCNVFMSRQLL